MTIADQPMTERAERVIKQEYVIPHSHPKSFAKAKRRPRIVSQNNTLHSNTRQF